VKYEFEENRKFGIWTGNKVLTQNTHRSSLFVCVDDEFAKRPAIRADIYKALYATGMYEDWVEGYGQVAVIDKERREAYVAEQMNRAS